MKAWLVPIIGVALLFPSNVFAETTANSHDELISELLAQDTILNMLVKHELSYMDETESQQKLSESIKIIKEIIYLEQTIDDSKYVPILYEWKITKRDLRIVSSVDELLQHKDAIGQMYNAAILIETAENLTTKISDRENLLQLKSILKFKWNPVKSDLSNAKSTSDVLMLESQIRDMEKIFDIAPRLYEKTKFLKANKAIIPTAIHIWSSLLKSASDSATIHEAYVNISDHRKTFSEIEHNLIEKSEIKYKELAKQSRGLNLNHEVKEINKMLENIRLVKNVKKDVNPFDHSNDEIINMILYKSGIKLDEIDSKIKYYSSAEYQKHLEELNEKTSRIQQIVDTSLSTNKMPEFNKLLYNIQDRLEYSKTRDNAEFDSTRQLIDVLFYELENLEREYKYVQHYAPIYESSDISTAEKKRIYFELLDDTLKVLNSFDNEDFNPYRDDFYKMVYDAKNSIGYGNFVAGHEKTYDILFYLQNNLFIHDPRIILDVTYDDAENLWNIYGAVYKHSFNARGKMGFSLYDVDGTNLGNLEFLNTKEGNFNVLWHNNVEPGLYIAKIEHGSSKDYQLVSVQDEKGTKFSQEEINMMNVASEFEKIEDFLQIFGGDNYERYDSKFAPTLKVIQHKLKQGEISGTQENIDDLRKTIQRYLPVRSSDAAIDATFEKNWIVISGQVGKLLDFPEDLFVCMFDQQGNRIYEIITRDDGAGNFDLVFPKPTQTGMIVVQLEYHDIVVTDILLVV